MYDPSIEVDHQYTENGNTYPVSVDEDGNSWGDITDDNAIHLDDCCDEWFDSLSKEDHLIVDNITEALMWESVADNNPDDGSWEGR